MREMKDSGVDWIGEIPAHWEVKRIKDIVTSGSGTTPKSSNEKYYDNGIYPWLITGDVQNNVITSNDIFITDLAVSEVTNLKLFPQKTVLLAMYGGGTIGNVGLMTYPAYINQACCALIPSKNIAEKYLFYYLLNKQKRIISTGVGGTQINLSQNKIVAYPIAIPPIEEQQAIADYLDKKTAEIDEQIILLEHKQNAYANLKQSLISQVVTRGLNPNAPLKDSGVDWIGEIPAHWEVKRIKDIVTSGSGTTPKSSNEKYYDNGIYPWLITGDVQNNVITSNDIFITDLAVSEVTNLKLFPQKTVLLAMYGGGTIGNVGLMTYPAYINQACCALIPSKNIAEKYLFYYLLNKQKRIISTGVGGTQINLSQNKIVAYPIAIPPIAEQQAIADYLDEKTAEIVEQISNIDKKINTYKRLKQSLIDEVVTGKRKI